MVVDLLLSKPQFFTIELSHFPFPCHRCNRQEPSNLFVVICHVVSECNEVDNKSNDEILDF